MTLSIALVCEAAADRITITTLAERIILESADWIERETLPHHVQWRGGGLGVCMTQLFWGAEAGKSAPTHAPP